MRALLCIQDSLAGSESLMMQLILQKMCAQQRIPCSSDLYEADIGLSVERYDPLRNDLGCDPEHSQI